MSRRLIIILCVVIAALAALLYWQFNKKDIIKSVIDKKVTTATDSIYKIRYDSSSIDEANGNATFYNISFQSDSLQNQLVQDNDTTGLPETLLNLHAQRLIVRGADVSSLLSGKSLAAKVIEIEGPQITLIQKGGNRADSAKIDTVALYKRILGKMNSISADTVRIVRGNVFIAEGRNAPHTAIKGINFFINNLKIDEAHAHNNLLDYFVKDAVAKVDTVRINDPDKLFLFQDIEYNAPKHFIKVARVYQKDKDAGKTFIDLKDNRITGLSTNEFVYNNRLKADSAFTGGGILSFYTGKNQKSKSKLEIDNAFFDKAYLRSLKWGKTKIQVFDRDNPAAQPFVLNNSEFSASGIQEVNQASNINRVIGNSSWKFKSDGFSFDTKDRIYKFSVAAIIVNNTNNRITLNAVNLKPQITEAQFMARQKYQNDYFNISAANIVLEGSDIESFLGDKVITANTMTLTPKISVYNDRTLTPNPASKVGQYPHQIFNKLPVAIGIDKVIIKNGYVSYRERGAISKKIGDVFFSNVNATINNVTNIPARLQKNNVILVNATALFLGKANLSTVWKLPVNTNNGAFEVSAKIGSVAAATLNPVIEPLGPARVRKGQVNSVVFDVKGNDHSSHGTYTINYSGVNVDVLKADDSDDGLKKRGLLSVAANMLLRNDVNKTVEADQPRDPTKSFFNLIWKGLFTGIKKAGAKIKI